MQSSGGLTGAGNFQGKDAILSGPAGGVVGAVRTSADRRARADHRLRHGRHLDRRLPLSPANTSGCCNTRDRRRADHRADDGHPHGRGRRRSILGFDGARMRVGPESAGADPGPACLRARRAAGGDGRQRGDRAAAAGVLPGDLRAGRRPAAGRGRDAGGVRALAARDRQGRRRRWRRGSCGSRSRTWRTRSRRSACSAGYDVSGYCLTVFGGAGAQDACAIADTLGMETCLIHPMASLLSAYGMGLADIRAARTQAMEAELRRASRLEAAALLDGLGVECAAEVEAQGVPARAIRLAPALLLKVKGTDTALAVALRRPGGDAGGLRGGAPRAVRLRSGRGGAGHRGGEAEAVGGAADLTEPEVAERERPEAEPEAALAGAGLARRRLGRGALRARARRWRRATGWPGRRCWSSRIPRSCRAGLAGAGHRARPCGADAGSSRGRSARGGRHAGRPGDARGVQQPLHVDRRADGGGAGEHRRQRHDQGAAGFLLRGVRRRGRPDRQRAAHAGASRLDGGEREGDHRAEPRHGAGGRLRAERALQRRHAPARHHRGAAGLGRGGRAGAVLHRGARTPYRRRRADAGVDAAGQPDDPRRGRLYRQLEAGGRRPVPRGGDAGAARCGDCIRRGRRRSTSPTCGRRWRPARRARRSCAGWWRSSGSTWSRPTWATCRTMPRSACGGRSRRCATPSWSIRWTRTSTGSRARSG